MISTSTAVARAIGTRHADDASRLTTHAVYFSVVCVAVVSAVGLLTQDALFTALGATAEMLPLIEAYMAIWFMAVVLLVVPMIAIGARLDAVVLIALFALGAALGRSWVRSGGHLTLRMADGIKKSST